jgi:hypothetical protein
MAGIPDNGKTLDEELAELGFAYDEQAKAVSGQTTSVKAGIGTITVAVSDIRKTVTVANDVDAETAIYKVISGHDLTVTAPAKAKHEFDGYTITKQDGAEIENPAKVTVEGTDFTLTAVSGDIDITLNYITNDESSDRDHCSIRVRYRDAETGAEIGGADITLKAGTEETVTAPEIEHYTLPETAEIRMTWDGAEEMGDAEFLYTRVKRDVILKARDADTGEALADAGGNPITVTAENLREGEYFDYADYVATGGALTVMVNAAYGKSTEPKGEQKYYVEASDANEISVYYGVPRDSSVTVIYKDSGTGAEIEREEIGLTVNTEKALPIKEIKYYTADAGQTEIKITFRGDAIGDVTYYYTRNRVKLTFVAKGKTIGSPAGYAAIDGVEAISLDARVAEYYDYSDEFSKLTELVLEINGSYTAPGGAKLVEVGETDQTVEVLYTLPNPAGGGDSPGGDSPGGSGGGSSGGSSGGAAGGGDSGSSEDSGSSGDSSDGGTPMTEYDRETVIELPNNVTVTVPAGSKQGDDAVIIIPQDAEGKAKLPGYDGIIGTRDDVTVSLPGGSEIRPDMGTLHLGKYNADVSVGTSGLVLSLHPGAVIESAPGSEFGYRVISELPFTDVAAGDWFSGDVTFAYWHEMVSGTGANLYSPGSATTRGMIVKMLHNLMGEPYAGTENPFKDVESGMWYEDAVKWAAANGIVRGYGDGNYGPNDSITREQMAAVRLRFMDYLGLNIEPKGDASVFADEDEISDFAKDAIEKMNRYGIIKGMDGNRAAPGKNATRAEVAAILHRLVVLLMRGEM